MAWFRTKTMLIEAQQWYPGHYEEMVCYACPHPLEAHVHTENGAIPIHERDWLVRDEQGRPWIVTASVFELVFAPDGGPSDRAAS